jgi:predicted MFS family arabinose efflux permease
VFYIFGAIGVVWSVFWFLWFRDDPQKKAGVTREELAEIGAGAPGSHARLSWKVALSSGNLWAVMLMDHSFCYGSYWFFSWMPTYLEKARGVTTLATYAALPYVLGALANMAGGYTSDRMITKIGLKWGRRVVGLGAMLTAGTLMLVSIAVPNRTLALVTLALSFAVSDFMLPNCWATCLDIGKKYAGTVTGTMNMAGQFGSTIASAAYGGLVESYGWNVPLAGVACLSLLSGLMWLKIDATKPLVPEELPPVEARAA